MAIDAGAHESHPTEQVPGQNLVREPACSLASARLVTEIATPDFPLSGEPGGPTTGLLWISPIPGHGVGAPKQPAFMRSPVTEIEARLHLSLGGFFGNGDVHCQPPI